MNEIETFLKKNYDNSWQIFNSRNTVGDRMNTVYHKDGITIDECPMYHYLEIFGLSEENFNSLIEDVNKSNI